MLKYKVTGYAETQQQLKQLNLLRPFDFCEINQKWKFEKFFMNIDLARTYCLILALNYAKEYEYYREIEEKIDNNDFTLGDVKFTITYE